MKTISFPPRVVELQSLRGLAATLVLFAHASYVYALTPGLRIGLDCLLNAHAAVILFFVLSGYVLQGSLMKSARNHGASWVFYVSRLFRILPAVWFASILAIGIICLFQRPIPLASKWFNQYFASSGLTFKTIVLSFLTYRDYLLPPLWTVFVELIGSAFMPLFAWLAIRGELRLWIVVLLLAFASVPLASLEQFHLNALSYLFDFALGAAAYSSQERLKRTITRMNLCSGPILSLVASGLVLCRSLWSILTRGHLVPLLVDYENIVLSHFEAFFSACLIVLIVSRPNGLAVLRSKYPIFLGDISFSIYLLHFPVLSGWAWFLTRANIGVSGSPIVSTVILMALTVMTTLPLAWGSFRFVELSGILLGKVCIGRLRRGKVPC